MFRAFVDYDLLEEAYFAKSERRSSKRGRTLLKKNDISPSEMKDIDE